MFETKFYTVCCRAMKVIRSISAVLLGALLLVVVYQIFARGIFNLPTPWTEEVCTILITYNTFIGGIVVMMRGEHIAIDLVSEHVSQKNKKYFPGHLSHCLHRCVRLSDLFWHKAVPESYHLQAVCHGDTLPPCGDLRHHADRYVHRWNLLRGPSVLRGTTYHQ